MSSSFVYIRAARSYVPGAVKFCCTSTSGSYVPAFTVAPVVGGLALLVSISVGLCSESRQFPARAGAGKASIHPVDGFTKGSPTSACPNTTGADTSEARSDPTPTALSVFMTLPLDPERTEPSHEVRPKRYPPPARNVNDFPIQPRLRSRAIASGAKAIVVRPSRLPLGRGQAGRLH